MKVEITPLETIQAAVPKSDAIERAHILIDGIPIAHLLRVGLCHYQVSGIISLQGIVWGAEDLARKDIHAYIYTRFHSTNGDDKVDSYIQEGMTLRDWFAGQALAGLTHSQMTYMDSKKEPR